MGQGGDVALLLRVQDAERCGQKSCGEKVTRKKAVAAREESWRWECPNHLMLRIRHPKFSDKIIIYYACRF